MRTFEEAGIEVKYGSHGNIKVYCPKCRDTRKNKTDKSLSVNVEEKMWNCHNCGWNGRLTDPKKKEYSKPLPPSINMSENAQKWLKNRGLCDYTIQRFKMTEKPEFMPQIGKESNCLCFQYFRGGELVNIKFRDGQKNFKLVKDAELVFFNLDSLEGVDEAVITEGEIDCMSVFEAGYREGILSVPNGASKGSQRIEYFDNSYEQVKDLKSVIIATDGDSPGIMLRMELARRFGLHICKYVEYPEGTKDLNEVLIKYGPEKVIECIRDAKAFPIDGISRIEDMEEELDAVFEEGFSRGETIGYDNFDKIFSIRPGELTTITGIPGSGKSAFVDQVLLRLAARAGWKIAICSPENQPIALHVGKISSIFIGESWHKDERYKRMTVEQWNLAKYFINEHYFFYNIGEVDMSLTGILDKAKQLIMRYGINCLLIDPWNTIEHSRGGMTETDYVSHALSVITLFAKQYQVHVFLIAHPTKISKSKDTQKYEVPTLYNISGSAHFFNKTDNGWSIYRDFETNIVYVYVQKVRFQFVGEVGSTSFHYERHTGRYAEEGHDFDREYRYFLIRKNMIDFL